MLAGYIYIIIFAYYPTILPGNAECLLDNEPWESIIELE
jgi:hypothetical protein